MDNPDGTRTRGRTRFVSSIAAILCVMLLCCAGTAVATLVANDTATNRFALDSGRQVTVEWREVPPSSNGNADANATFDVNRIAWNNTTAVLTAKGKSTTLNAYSVGNDGTLDNMDAYIFLSEERSEQSYRDLLIGSTMRVTGSTVLPNEVGIIYNISLDQASTERPTKTVNGKTHTYRKYRVTVKKPITTTVYESQLSDLGSVQPTIPFYRGYTFTGWTKPIATGPDSYFVRSTWEYRGEIEPDESTSFAAVYGGGTLVFGRGVAPETHDGANLSQLDGMDLVWYGIEDEAYTRDAVPWASMASKIARVEFRDALSPISTAFWFSGFSRLAEISFGKLDGSRITDMQSMFSDCTSLESADMTGLSLGKVTCINNLFYGCDALQGVGFPATFSTELRECAQVFLSCDNLPKIDMSMVETSKVTSFHRLFWGCNNLRSVDAPCVTSSAADMAGMFENCWSLPSIDVSGWDLSGVTNASALFKTCSALETIYVDDPKTNWLDSITANKADAADMFSGCGKLVGGAGTKYDSGSAGAARARVDKLSGGIGYFTYRSWNGTFSITGDTRVGSTLSVQLGDVPAGAILRYQWLRGGSPISGATAKNYTTTGEDVGRYISCRLTISTEQGSRQSNALLISGPRAFAVYSADDGSLSLYKRDTVPSAGGTFEGKAATAVYTGFEYARYHLPTAVPWYDARGDVKSVSVVDEGISPVSTAYLFWGMENCSAMDLGKLDTSVATDMTYMFGLCGSLSALDLSGLETSMVEDMSLMFYKCSGIASLDVSGFDTSKVANIGKMFSGCSSLTTIYASEKWSTGSAANTGDMFADCSLLVGGCGTTYDPAIVDGTRALIDGIDGQSGYLTGKELPTLSGTLSISGTTHVGDELTASAEGTPVSARLAFSWHRDSEPIAGTNAATYTLTQEDVGHKVRCTARADGYSGELASAEIGPVRAAQGDVEGQLASMTLHEKVCQMFCVYPEDLGGSGALTAAGAVQQQTLAAYPYGGVCYFLQNIKSEDQARTLVSTIESFSEVPMFHAVDEEGGRVQRIGGTTYSGAVRGAGIGNRLDAMYTYRDQGEQTAYDNARLLAGNLKRLGMNWDFAPVADVNSNPDNPVIGDRAYGDDFDATGPLVAAAVRGFADSGVGSCLKHFPGHGDTSTDSHNGAASVSKTIEQLRNEEFKTFEAGIAAGVDAVMMGHLMIEGATESVPASCSREFVTDVLRGELGFDGVITTDGMGMGAITKVYGTDRQGHVAAVMACLDAGIDVFLLPGDPQACVDAIEAAVAAGTVSESRIDESARRILTMKWDLTSKES